MAILNFESDQSIKGIDVKGDITPIEYSACSPDQSEDEEVMKALKFWDDLVQQKSNKGKRSSRKYRKRNNKEPFYKRPSKKVAVSKDLLAYELAPPTIGNNGVFPQTPQEIGERITSNATCRQYLPKLKTENPPLTHLFTQQQSPQTTVLDEKYDSSFTQPQSINTPVYSFHQPLTADQSSTSQIQCAHLKNNFYTPAIHTDNYLPDETFVPQETAHDLTLDEILEWLPSETKTINNLKNDNNSLPQDGLINSPSAPHVYQTESFAMQNSFSNAPYCYDYQQYNYNNLNYMCYPNHGNTMPLSSFQQTYM